MKGFLKHPELFEDTYKIADLFNLSDYTERLWGKIQAMENKGIFGFIGPYGCGKSTIIHNMESNHSLDTDPLWVHFDAWKYHDKKDLWEGFIIDVGMQLYSSKAEIIKQIDGKNITLTDGLLTTLSVVPGFSGLEGLKRIFESKGITRVFEFQELLSKFISGNKRDIIITIEDIDRAGEQGLIFLETLNFFIKHELDEKNIKIITLIGDKSYSDPDSKLSYLKSIDITEFFSAGELNFEDFLDVHFDFSIFQDVPKQNLAKSQLSALCSRLLTGDFSLRQIKHILRIANNNFILQNNRGLPADFRVTIAIEFSKFIVSSNGQTEYDRMKPEIVWDSLIFRFLKMIIFDIDNFVKFESYLLDSRRVKVQSNIGWINTESFSPDPGKIVAIDSITNNLAIPKFYLDFK